MKSKTLQWLLFTAGILQANICYSEKARSCLAKDERTFLAFAWANQSSTASYNVHTAYSHISDSTNPEVSDENFPIHIIRRATGQYSVQIVGGRERGGNVQVNAYGQDSNFCNVGRWTGGSSDNFHEIEVNCFDRRGENADSQFTIRYLDIIEGCTDTSYSWNRKVVQDDAVTTPNATYHWEPLPSWTILDALAPEVSSAIRQLALTETVVERRGKAAYLLRLPVEYFGPVTTDIHELRRREGFHQVTAYAPNLPFRCYTKRKDRRSPASVNEVLIPYSNGVLPLYEPGIRVACRNFHHSLNFRDSFQDTAFTHTRINHGALLANATVGANIVVKQWASEDRRVTLRQQYLRGTTSGTEAEIERLGEGNYEITLPLTFAGMESNAMLTTDIDYGQYSNCKVYNWHQSNGLTKIKVNCFNNDGDASGQSFTLSFIAL